MADIEFGRATGDVYPSRGESVVNLMNWLGAFVSVALIAGLAWWGYQLLVRDVTGVPVVRALAGPMRIAPEDPGGQNADHQGLAVNNIAAKGEAEATADRLVLAPKPTILTDEDQSAGELRVLNAVDEAVVEEDEMASADAQTSAEAGEVVATDQATLIQAALLLAQETSDSPEASPVEEAVVATIPEDAIPASIGGVTRSVIPQARPVTVVASQAEVVPVANTTDSKVIDPATIPTGTRLAQLGAFETKEIAEKEWVKLSERFDDFLSDKSRVIQKAQSGGKVFYRLRAHGFDDLSDARRFCSALMAGKANCIPVVTR